jgi:hypothetical protein
MLEAWGRLSSLEARSGRKASAFDGQGSKRKQLQLLKENLSVNEDIDLFF